MAGIEVGLRHGDAEEPAAMEIRVCSVDARDVTNSVDMVEHVLSTVYQGCMDHFPSPFGVSVL